MKSMAQLCFGLAALSLTACGGSQSSGPTPSPNVTVTPAAAARRTQCAIDEDAYTSRGNLVSNPPLVVAVERQFQNVIHRDCHGTLVSSGMETVQAPTAEVFFQPALLPGRAGAVRIFNSTACDWSSTLLKHSRVAASFFGRMTGDDTGRLRIVVDAAPGAATFRVKPGVNLIYYSFFDSCVPDSLRHKVNLEASCPSSAEISSGMISIDVHYSERTRPGDLIKQDATCQ